jgi:hypothetical protein
MRLIRILQPSHCEEAPIARSSAAPVDVTSAMLNPARPVDAGTRVHGVTVCCVMQT